MSSPAICIAKLHEMEQLQFK